MRMRKTVSIIVAILLAIVLLPITSENVNALTLICPTITSVTSEYSNTVIVRWNPTSNPDGTVVEVCDFTNNQSFKVSEVNGMFAIDRNIYDGQTIKVGIVAYYCEKDRNGNIVREYQSSYSPIRTIVVGSGKTSGTSSSIKINTWSPLQYKSQDTTLKYQFTLNKPGYIKPVLYIDTERSYGNLENSYVTNSGLQKIYSGCDGDNHFWEDSSGHQWIIQKYEKMRLPAGTYYFYFPNDGLDAEYGYFKFMISFTSEYGKSNVEKEFNNSRNTATKIVANKMYRGNIGSNSKDIDYYRIKIARKQKVTVTMWYPQDMGITNGSWDVCKIVSSKGKQLADAEWLGITEDSSGKHWEKVRTTKTLKKGTYYVKVSGFYGYDDYKFKVTKK